MSNVDIIRKLRQDIREIPEKLAPMVLERAKAYTPVRTGYLQSRWEVRVEPKAIVLTNDAEYASFVEYGTPRMAPVAMGRRAIKEIDGMLQQLVKEINK